MKSNKTKLIILYPKTISLLRNMGILFIIVLTTFLMGFAFVFIVWGLGFTILNLALLIKPTRYKIIKLINSEKISIPYLPWQAIFIFGMQMLIHLFIFVFGLNMLIQKGFLNQNLIWLIYKR
jgi:hypothetical protein